MVNIWLIITGLATLGMTWYWYDNKKQLEQSEQQITELKKELLVVPDYMLIDRPTPIPPGKIIVPPNCNSYKIPGLCQRYV